ncbi:MAG: deoxyguanosinetriphosphate triphosphohydrolase [Ferrovibrionaceae bacterium]
MMDWRRLLSARRLGHVGAEAVTPERSPFQKDWDRVVFSSAFRRLQDKTQVHSLPDNDYVRTRLTHSLEVSSVGRSLGAAIGRTIVDRHRLRDIEAAEFGHIVAAACLAHDIGNPPFGHFGENTMRHWFATGGARYLDGLSEAESLDLLNFEGNAQGFRVVSRLQSWHDAGGLRLTCATLASFAKYPRGSADPASRVKGKFGYFTAEADLFADVAGEVGLIPRGPGTWCRHPLAYLLEAADDICYRVVDIEDGFRLGRLNFREAEELLLDLVGGPTPRYKEIDEPQRAVTYLRAKAIGALIDEAAEVFLAREPEITEGVAMGDLLSQTSHAATLQQIEQLTRERIFQTRERYEIEIGGAEIIETLLQVHCAALAEREAAGRDVRLSPRAEALVRLLPDLPAADAPRYRWLMAVTDFVSGATDSYALSRYRRIKGLVRD